MAMKPEEALRVIAAARGDAVCVPTMTTAPAWRTIAPDDLSVACVGFMGGASSLGLGLALARPDRRVLVFDGDGKSVGAIAIDDPGRFALAVDSANKRVYVASYVRAGARLFVIDAGTNTLVGKLTLGGLPFGLALDPTKNLLYASSFTDGTVTTIDRTTRLALLPQPAGRQAAGLAVNPTSGQLYVAAFGDATVVTRP